MKFLREKGIAIIACADTKLIRRSGRTAMSLAGEVLTQVTDLGGASAIGNIARAAAAINAGLCETVVCLAADAHIG